MSDLVEINSIDTRYERCRMRSRAVERRLALSMQAEGIRDPLGGVVDGERRILLDGFKRLRVARRLKIAQVPFRVLGEGQADGILCLMRSANAQSLAILEQAHLIRELRDVHHFSIADIGQRLERSVSWVSMRSGLLAELRPAVAERIMRGEFPAYSYMYTLRHFMRMKQTQPDDIESFVVATAGHGLSTRDIDLLARGFFLGGTDLRREISEGRIDWCLEMLKNTERVTEGCSSGESGTLADLELVARKMRRLTCVLRAEQSFSPGFLAQAHILCGGLLRVLSTFTNKVRGVHDRSRHEAGDIRPAQEGDGHPPDRAPTGDQSQHGEGHHRGGR